MSLTQKIGRWTPRSERAGGYRSEVKRSTARKARRISRRIARGDEKAEGRALTHGWAD